MSACTTILTGRQYHILKEICFFLGKFCCSWLLLSGLANASVYLPSQNTSWHQHILDPLIGFSLFFRQLFTTFKFMKQVNSYPGYWILLGFSVLCVSISHNSNLYMCSLVSTPSPTMIFIVHGITSD